VWPPNHKLVPITISWTENSGSPGDSEPGGHSIAVVTVPHDIGNNTTSTSSTTSG
jgi:hypothetical protein